MHTGPKTTSSDRSGSTLQETKVTFLNTETRVGQLYERNQSTNTVAKFVLLLSHHRLILIEKRLARRGIDAQEEIARNFAPILAIGVFEYFSHSPQIFPINVLKPKEDLLTNFPKFIRIRDKVVAHKDETGHFPDGATLPLDLIGGTNQLIALLSQIVKDCTKIAWGSRLDNHGSTTFRFLSCDGILPPRLSKLD
jgi:hypothetical protein